MNTPILAEAKQSVRQGDQEKAVAVAQKALDAGMDPATVLEQGFVPGIAEVGQLFEDEEIYLPELMLAAEAMKAAAKVCNAAIPKSEVKHKGRVVLGTVAGDIHDIGKSIVESFLSASGFQVHDMGRDVPVKDFLEKAVAEKADVIATSALLTTTMPAQKALEQALKEAGLREKIKTIVGGAPVDQRWADAIGADGYAEDAAGAAQKIEALIAG
jgi:trimethylamine corrinoid protein